MMIWPQSGIGSDTGTGTQCVVGVYQFISLMGTGCEYITVVTASTSPNVCHLPHGVTMPTYYFITYICATITTINVPLGPI